MGLWGVLIFIVCRFVIAVLIILGNSFMLEAVFLILDLDKREKWSVTFGIIHPKNTEPHGLKSLYHQTPHI